MRDPIFHFLARLTEADLPILSMRRRNLSRKWVEFVIAAKMARLNESYQEEARQ